MLGEVNARLNAFVSSGRAAWRGAHIHHNGTVHTEYRKENNSDVIGRIISPPPLGETATSASGPRQVCAHFFEFYRSPRVRSASAAVSPWPWNSTVSGHGAGVARAIGHLLAWVARARRGHGACMSCSPRDIAPCCWSWSLGGAAGPRRILQQARKCGSAGLLGVQREKKYSFQTFKHI
eukprot:gene22528-biopygen2743